MDKFKRVLKAAPKHNGLQELVLSDGQKITAYKKDTFKVGDAVRVTQQLFGCASIELVEE